VAYRAEIQIGVKGVEELTKLQKRLEGTNFKIDEINKKQSTAFGGLAQSIRNYSQQLNLAKKALSKVAAATPQETKAVNNYVTALGNANAARERQNKLIQQEIANRTGATAALKAYNAAAAAPTQRGAATTMAGSYMRGAFRGGSQYPGPIGPGAASSTALSSPLPARSPRTGRAEQLAREAALKSQANQKEFEAQKAFQTKLFNIEKQFENSLIRQRVEADNAEFNRLLKRLDAEKSKRNEINTLTERSNKKQLEDFDRRLREAGNLRGQTSPIGGAANIPGSPAAKQTVERSKRAESMMLGAGFPLLMGGGPAQVTGALLGSTVGTGFGGQILGSAIAQQMQDAVVRVTELQNAINNLDMSALRDSALLVNGELATQLEMLKEAGAASTAQAVAAEEVYKQFGLGSQASELVKQRADAIKNAWDKVVGTVSSLIALLAQPFIAVLVPILNLVSLVAKGFTEIFNLIANITNVPGLDKLLGLQGTDEAAGAKSAASKAAAIASGKELENMQKLAALEKQRRSGNTADAKIANERIDLQEKLNSITEEYAAKLKEIQQTPADIGIGSAYNNTVKMRDLALQTAKDESRKTQILIEQNAEHERALSLIKAQSMLDNGRVDLVQKRMSMESSIASARSSALLAINSLEMQRATNSGDTAKQLQLQVQRANLIYNQTVLQVQQEQKKAKLAALTAQIKLKELQSNVALRQAKGEANAADFAAIELQKQALQLTLEGVNASAQIAQFNLQTAGAIRQQTIEQAKFNSTAARAGGGGGGGGAIGGGGLGGGGASGGATVYGGGTRSIGSATTGSLARALSAAGVTGTFSEAQAGGILAAKRQARVDAFQAATKGTADYTSMPSNRELERAGFAEGGYVTRPTNALIGEAGESEYVIPSSKMNSAMQRYSSGVRGEAVTAGAVAAGSTTNANYSSQQNMYYGGGAASVNITTGPVIRMGNNDYVSMSDLQRGMSTAVSAGQANMMRSMRRSYGARRSMGA
jgi:hypothetical protein